MNSLAGKVAVVTGAGSGFGKGIATCFAEAGAKVAILDLDIDSAQSVAAELGSAAFAVQTNVTDTVGVSNAVTSVTESLGTIDIWVNNAGVGLTPTALEELSEQDFDKVMNVNMRSIYISAKLIVPLMKQRGSGCILNMASTAGVSPRPGLTWYNASKGWVITATKSMAIELAPDNIRVNALNPVAGETPMLATFMGGDTPEQRERFLASIPLGRFSTPQDLGQAATFLCSDAASMITGVALEVDGGRCI